MANSIDPELLKSLDAEPVDSASDDKSIDPELLKSLGAEATPDTSKEIPKDLFSKLGAEAIDIGKKAVDIGKEYIAEPIVKQGNESFTSVAKGVLKEPVLTTSMKLGGAAMSTIFAPFDYAGEKVAESLASHGHNPYISAAAGTTVAITPDIAFTAEGLAAVNASASAARESEIMDRIAKATKVFETRAVEPIPLGIEFKPNIEAPTTLLKGGEPIQLESAASKELTKKEPLALSEPSVQKAESFTMRDKPDLAKLQKQDKGVQPTYPEDIGKYSLKGYVSKRKLSGNIPDFQQVQQIVAPADLYNPMSAELMDESRKQYIGLDSRLKIMKDESTGRTYFRLSKDPVIELRTKTQAEISSEQATKNSTVIKELDLDARVLDSSPILPGSDKVPVIKQGNVAGSSSWLQTVWNRLGAASEDVVAKMGSGGKSLANDIRTIRDVPAVRYGDFSADYNKFFKGMSKQQAKQISTALADALEGRQTEVKFPDGLVEFIQRKLATIATDAGNVGLTIRDSEGNVKPFAPRDNYFPRMLRQEILDGILSGNDKVLIEIAKKMVEGRSQPNFSVAFERVKGLRKQMNFSKYGHLERAREFDDMPPEFYDRNALRVIPEYIRTALYRIEEARNFGPNGEKVLEKLDQIAQEGHDHQLARRIIERFTHIEPRDTLALQATQGLRNLTAGSFIQWQSTIKHLPQYLSPAYEATIASTVKGFVKAWTQLGTEEAARAGQVFTNAAEEYLGEVYGGAPGGTRGFANKAFKLNGMTKLIEFLKKYSALVGKDHVQNNLIPRLLKGSKSAAVDLENLGFDSRVIIRKGGMSGEEINVAAKRFADNVTGTVDTTKLPHFWTSSTGRFFAQFKNLSYAMGRQNISLVRRAIQSGDIGRLSKLFVGTAMSGYAVKKFLETVGGQNSEQPDITGMEGADDLIGDLSEGTLWGPVVDLTLATMKGPKYVESWFTPPALRNAYEVLNATGQLIKGDVKPIVKEAVRRIPLVGKSIRDLIFQE